MGFSGMVSLISLCGCSRVALSSIYVGSLVVLGFYMLVFPFLVGSLSTGFTGVHNSHLILL